MNLISGSTLVTNVNLLKCMGYEFYFWKPSRMLKLIIKLRLKTSINDPTNLALQRIYVVLKFDWLGELISQTKL